MTLAPILRRPSASSVITFVAAAAVMWAAVRLAVPLAGELTASAGSAGSAGVERQEQAGSTYTVTGVVFRDLDGDGLYTAGAEPGEGGWQVYADLNSNDRYDPGADPVATTREQDAGPGKPAGSYELADVPPGTGSAGRGVRLVEHQPKFEGRAGGDSTRWREDVSYDAPQEHVIYIPTEPQTFPHRDFMVARVPDPAPGAVANAK
jgi:hypothetical protein